MSKFLAITANPTSVGIVRGLATALTLSTNDFIGKLMHAQQLISSRGGCDTEPERSSSKQNVISH